MPGFKDALMEHGPKLAMMLMAAKSGGMEAVTGLQRGLQEAKARQQQMESQRDTLDYTRGRQQQMDAQSEEDRAFSRSNTEADNARADQQQRMTKFQQVYELMQKAGQTQAETASDPAMADAALQQQATAAAGAYGLPTEQVTPFMPPMAPLISARKKKQAQDLYARAEQRYNPKGDHPEWETSITLQTGEQFGDVSPAKLREMFEAPAIDAMGAPAEPYVAPTKLAQPGSFEEYVDAPPDRQATIEAARRRYQQADDRPRASQQQSASGLPPRAQSRVNRLADMFRTDPAVKRTNIVAEGYSFASGLDDNSQSSSDDQALIYAFAKAMDPESVVREGEYATVQKYAQSWAQSFGFSAQRVFSNTEFLSTQSRKNMKATIAQKYQAARKQYDNVRVQSAAQIDKITGGADGADYLIDYAEAMPAASPAATPALSGAGTPTYQDYLNRRGGAQ